ncbi:MAG: amidohydrolase [Armatimonadetes bacterium]|nr:amidohydrolase [Armatimonadota bacterium]
MLPLADGPIIDLHAHIHPFALPVRRASARELVADMDRLGIEVTAVSSARAIMQDMVEGNAQLARDLETTDRLRGYVFANPNQVELSISQVRRYLPEPGFIGLKLYSGGYIGHPLNCREHERILDVVASEFPRAVVLVHCGENDPANFPGLLSLAREFASLTFLAGHMGSKLWRDALPVLAQAPNIMAEICAPVPARNRIEDAVATMGAERVVFGSDWPIISQPYMLGCVGDADISDSDRRAILYDNAARILRQAGQLADEQNDPVR